MIKRDFYLEQIQNNMWNGEIKVITGDGVKIGLSILLDVGFDSTVNLPEQFGEFLVGDGHAPATYYVLINDSFMSEIR